MDDDFERRRELRRQKREEMRMEAERMAYRRSEEDEEEAARERRRRARQERLRNKESEEGQNPPESVELNNSHSVTVTETVSSSVVISSQPGEGDDEEQALLERLAKREERRQRRMKEALDRQKDLETDTSDYRSEVSSNSGRSLLHKQEEEPAFNSKEEEKEEAKEEEEAAPEEEEEQKEEEEEEEEKPRRSYLREQMEEEMGRKSKQQNGGVYEDSKHKKVERTQSRGSMRSPEAPAMEDLDAEGARLEAERKLEELKRRRDETESEEFERMRQKQQEAEVELEELKRKREERRKVLEEEEKQKKQEEAERKAREEEEKRRMKEEIERRRAEAAERRQKVGEEVDGDGRKPFVCVSPRGSSLKIGERAEFLNKSAQKSAVKASHSPVVSKIDNRLEQYTTAVQTNKDARSPRAAALDLPMVSDGVRNIKSMWEKGNVFSSGTGTPSSNKDAAGIKVGVAGRINDWLNKTPEPGKMSGGRPADLKPGDVTSKRSLWENKGSSAAKVTSRGESKSFANGMGH
ncbi:caldesmon 1a isoform X2 [Hoplias malabaricus]|uniref:caldesmon 1a isoform X2 n=1 Tax=Hoplias malabaricus TaxID=27720 RepID=UPI00346330A8